MKIALNIICIILFTCQSAIGQSGIYNDFNSDLIWLRNAVKKGDWIQANNHQKVVLKKWSGIKQDMKKQYGTNRAIEQSLNAYQKAYNKKDSKFAIESIDGVIDDMQEMRKEKNQPVPFDILWRAYSSYKQVHSTVNDQMMNLYDWFEFNDQINEYMCRWDDYEVLSKAETIEILPRV